MTRLNKEPFKKLAYITGTILVFGESGKPECSGKYLELELWYTSSPKRAAKSLLAPSVLFFSFQTLVTSFTRQRAPDIRE